MAGIGFVLRKLLKKEELSSYGAAFFHSMMAACGPWIITILTLSAFFFLSQSLVSQIAYTEFRLIILFNFSVSLVFAAPVANCSTRYLADILYTKRFDLALGLLMGMLLILFIPALPFSAAYYLLFTDMSLTAQYLAILNFMLICTIWHVSIFISTLKYYKVLSLSFMTGMGLSLLFVLKYADSASLEGMILGFNLGLGFVLAALFALVAIEYPPQVKDLFQMLSYFKKYWEIPLGFLLYAIGLWADKWIMWLAPEAVVLPNLMRMNPDYDTAMFISYLSVIPSMTLFLLIQETTFYDVYYRYFYGIQHHQNYDQILKNHNLMTKTLITISRQLILIQLIICVSTIVFAPYLFTLIGSDYIQLSMFQIGTLGASFQILGLFIMVFLQYFDDRKSVLALQAFFAASNTALTILTLYAGPAWYGYGFCGASLLTFILGALFLNSYVYDLEFNTFVTQNSDDLAKRSGMAQAEQIEEDKL